MFEKSNIETVIQEKLFQRIRAMNREGVEFDPLAPASDGVQDQAVQAWLSKACWARVISAVTYTPPLPEGTEGPPLPPNSSSNTENSAGKLMRMSSAFNGDGNGGYSPINKPITSQDSLFTSDSKALFRPHSGITGINTSFMSQTVQSVDISWKLWDIRQFENYENAFLKHGRIVTVEFGWSTPQTVSDRLDVANVSGMKEIYKKQQEHILNMGGDYYVTTGKIINFDFSVGQNGEYICNTKLSAMGNDMFAGQISDDESSAPIKIRTDSEDMDRAMKISQNTFANYIKSLDKHLEKAKDEEGVYCHEESGKAWCTWGYFEDKILNTYFAFSSDWSKDIPTLGDHDNSCLLMYIRSKHFPNNSVQINELNNTCRYHSDISTKSLDIYLPGSIEELPTSDSEVFTNQDEKVQGNYKTLREQMKGLKDKFINNKFHDENIDAGIIRNFVFSADFYKSIWGGGISTVQSGMNSHWNTVTAQYGGFWNFQAQSDVTDTSRVGIFDDYSPPAKSISVINPFKNPEEKTDFNNIVKDKCFVFSVYGRHSIITNFNISVNMSPEMATMATYHTNKTSTGQSLPGPDEVAINAMAAFQFNKPPDAADSYPGAVSSEDMILKELTFPFMEGKFVDRDGPDDPYVLKDVSKDGLDFMADPTSAGKNKDAISKEIDQLNESEELQEKLDEAGKDKNYWYKKGGETDKTKLIYDQEGNMLDIYSRTMVGLINQNLIDPKTKKSTVDPMIPINVSFTIPGIGGIKPFDMFHIDYLPEEHRQRCMFQVTKLSHKLSTSGWTTDIESVMRIDGEETAKNSPFTDTDIVSPDEEKGWLKQVNKLEEEEKPPKEKNTEKTISNRWK